MLFGYGIAGTILILPLYFVMAKLFFKYVKALRIYISNFLEDPLSTIFSIYFLSSVASKFTIDIYLFSSDFTGQKLAETAVLMGLGFALYRKTISQIEL